MHRHPYPHPHIIDILIPILSFIALMSTITILLEPRKRSAESCNSSSSSPCPHHLMSSALSIIMLISYIQFSQSPRKRTTWFCNSSSSSISPIYTHPYHPHADEPYHHFVGVLANELLRPVASCVMPTHSVTVPKIPVHAYVLPRYDNNLY